MVTCMDSRIDPLRMIGLGPGDAKIFRNPGGRVTPQALEALVLGVHLLNVRRILVVPHTRCAMASATEEELRERIGESSGLDASWQRFGVVKDQRDALRRDVAAVRSHPLIGDRAEVGGFLYDVDTGLLEAARVTTRLVRPGRPPREEHGDPADDERRGRAVGTRRRPPLDGRRRVGRVPHRARGAADVRRHRVDPHDRPRPGGTAPAHRPRACRRSTSSSRRVIRSRSRCTVVPSRASSPTAGPRPGCATPSATTTCASCTSTGARPLNPDALASRRRHRLRRRLPRDPRERRLAAPAPRLARRDRGRARRGTRRAAAHRPVPAEPRRRRRPRAVRGGRVERGHGRRHPVPGGQGASTAAS